MFKKKKAKQVNDTVMAIALLMFMFAIALLATVTDGRK